MKTLIVYFSRTGSNALLAKNLSKLIPDSDTLEVKAKGNRKEFSIFLDLLFNRNPAVDYMPVDWENYSRVIICSPVWNYKVAHPMRSFLRTEKNNFSEYAFLTLCSGREEQQHKLENQLEDVLGQKPLFVHQLLRSSFLDKNNVESIEDNGLEQKNFDEHKDLLHDVVERLKRESEKNNSG